MIYAGIDPGFATGGVALLSGHWCEVHDLPIFEGQGIDCTGLIDILRSADIDMCIVEKQSSRPKQGVVSAFKIGMGYGQILACLAAAKVPHKIVTPTQWKKALCLSKDKDASRARAVQLYPTAAPMLKRKKDEHRAEALLLAAYGEATA